MSEQCNEKKWCSHCQKDNHNDSECWCTRVLEPAYITNLSQPFRASPRKRACGPLNPRLDVDLPGPGSIALDLLRKVSIKPM
jgi:hypothetical protein